MNAQHYYIFRQGGCFQLCWFVCQIRCADPDHDPDPEILKGILPLQDRGSVVTCIGAGLRSPVASSYYYYYYYYYGQE